MLNEYYKLKKHYSEIDQQQKAKKKQDSTNKSKATLKGRETFNPKKMREYNKTPKFCPMRWKLRD